MTKKYIAPNSVWEKILVVLGTVGLWLFVFFLIALLLLFYNYPFWSGVICVREFCFHKVVFFCGIIYGMAIIMCVGLPISQDSWNSLLFKVSWIRNMIDAESHEDFEGDEPDDDDEY